MVDVEVVLMSSVLSWVDPQYDRDGRILCPAELEAKMNVPSVDDEDDRIDPKIIDRIKGSMMGMALGDALGAHVEFRPFEYLQANPVSDMKGGGTWSLQIGQVCSSLSFSFSETIVEFSSPMTRRWVYVWPIL